MAHQNEEKTAEVRNADGDTPGTALGARPRGNIPKTRRCMACGQEFESEGWHNRLCRACRKYSYSEG